MSSFSCSTAAAVASTALHYRTHSTDSMSSTFDTTHNATRAIHTGCSAARQAVAKTSPALRRFIREVRESRGELDAVLGELQSLEGVLELLGDDAGGLPADLARRTPPLLRHCASIVQQVEGYMHVCNGLGLAPRDKRFRWVAIRADMDKLRLTLAGYKATLAVVTDLVRMCDQSCLSSDASGFREEQKQDLTRVMGDMGSLRGRLQGDFGSNYAVSDLEGYLDAMLLQATNLGSHLQLQVEGDKKRYHHHHHHSPTSSSGTNSTSGGDAPDSAIDMDGPPSPYGHGHGHAQVLPPGVVAGRRSLPIVEVQEFLDELSTSRAPTPPPKASRRSSVKHAVTSLPLDAALGPPPSSSTTLSPFPAGALPGLSRPESTRSVSEYSAMLIDSEGYAVVPRRVSSLRSLAGVAAATTSTTASGSDGDARSTMGSLRATSPPVINEDDYNPYGIVSASKGFTTTTILGGAAARDSVDSAMPPPIKDKRLSTSLSTLRLFGRKNSLSTPAQPTRPASSLGVSRGSQILHSLHVPGVSSSSSSSLNRTEHSPSRADAVRSDIIRPSTSIGGIRERGTHVLTALAGPSEEEEEEGEKQQQQQQQQQEQYQTTTPSPTESVPTPFVTNISSGPAATGRKASVDTTTNTIVTQSSGSRPPRPSTAVTSNGAASIRSNSSRISSMFRRVSLWRPRSTEDSAQVAEDAEPDDIFGVSLKKTMQMAASVVKTHHDGAKASSRRQFPRCVLACVNMIRDRHGVYAPNIFGGDTGMPLSGSGGPGMLRVAALREQFSTPPAYGADVDWAGHDVHDAAELLMLFLQQLPRPLVTETVAKRWIVMSKQATLPGSMGLRLDECIDFWDEALLGVRGAARDLFKLLLNLWGDVADAADVNDMTAERLAARLLNPLMHLPAGKYTTDYMLGLAFLIRKRSEYNAVLRGGRKSKAAF